MGNLLDTHTLIWFMNGNDQLSSKARKQIENGTNYVSIASLWDRYKDKYWKTKITLLLSFHIRTVNGKQFRHLADNIRRYIKHLYSWVPSP